MSRFGNIISGQMSAAIFAFVILGGVPGTGLYSPDAIAAIRSPARSALGDDKWKIYCAGRITSNPAETVQTTVNPAVFLALRLRKNEVVSAKGSNCLTDQLTVKFVTNWVNAPVFGTAQSINFSLPVKIADRYKKIGFSFSTNDSDSRVQKRRLTDILKDCDVDRTPNELGFFRIYGNEKSCKTYPARVAKSSAMVKSYAVNSTGDITHMTCYATCIMSINFENRIVKLIFSKKIITAWEEIRTQALAVLSRRVVLNYETGRCTGNLCDALMLEWN